MNETLQFRRRAFAAPKVWGAPAFYVAVLGLYLWATKPAFLWVMNEVSSGYGGVAIIAALAGYAGLVWRFGFPSKYLPLTALLLVMCCALGTRWSFAILQQLSASLALLGLFGFFAAHSRVSWPRWRAGLVMAGLAALALPFALVPGTGMGFYLRLMTADAAAQILALAGHSSLAAHDVLIFDNGIAQVDLPCSGLKSLFVGTGFYCAASLILRRAVSVKWMIGYAIFAGLLIIANTVRVTVLIWVSEILLQRGVAETIHMPLGVMLFCLACLCGVFILLKVPGQNVKAVSNLSKSRSFAVMFAANTAACILLVFAGTLFPAQTSAFNPKLTPPPSMGLTAVNLTPAESRFFGTRSRTAAGKWMFEYKGLSGSMLVVQSGAVNGLHAPEVCLLGNGMSVDHMETMTSGNKNYRWLTVDQKRRNAVYWMQSQDVVTDDFRMRFKEYVLGGQADWIMVTILLDDRLNLPANAAEITPETTSLLTLMDELQSHYSHTLGRGGISGVTE